MDKGSVTNLKYCRRFYALYSQSDIIRQQLVDEYALGTTSLPTIEEIEAKLGE